MTEHTIMLGLDPIGIRVSRPKRTAFSFFVILGLDPRIANGTTDGALAEYHSFRAGGDPRVKPEDDGERDLSAYSALISMPMGFDPGRWSVQAGHDGQR